MARYQVVLLKAGPKWNANRDEARHKLMGKHLAYFRDLVKAGTLVAVPLTKGAALQPTSSPVPVGSGVEVNPRRWFTN